MPRKPIEQKKLEQILDDLIFIPTPAQRKAKARYWVRAKQATFTDMGPTLPEVTRVIKDRRIPAWWQEPGFKEWFRNEEEFKERMEYIANLALDTVEEILGNPSARESARMAAAKLAIEVAGKMPKADIQQFADAKINNMDAGQLRDFIQQTAPKLLELKKAEEPSEE